MRKSVVALLAMLACALGFTLTVADPGPEAAFAGCDARPIAQMRDEADATAIGTIVAIDRPDPWFLGGSPSDPVTYWIEVSQAADGAVQELVEVTSRGYPLDFAAEGRSYLLFLRGQTPAFTSDACSSIPLPIGSPEEAETLESWDFTAPDPGGAELPRAGVPWGPIVLGVVIAAMVLLLVRDARTRARRATT